MKGSNEEAEKEKEPRFRMPPSTASSRRGRFRVERVTEEGGPSSTTQAPPEHLPPSGSGEGKTEEMLAQVLAINKDVVNQLGELQQVILQEEGAPPAPTSRTGQRVGPGTPREEQRPFSKAFQILESLKRELEHARDKRNEHETVMKALKQKTTTLTLKLDQEQAELAKLRKENAKLREQIKELGGATGGGAHQGAHLKAKNGDTHHHGNTSNAEDIKSGPGRPPLSRAPSESERLGDLQRATSTHFDQSNNKTGGEATNVPSAPPSQSPQQQQQIGVQSTRPRSGILSQQQQQQPLNRQQPTLPAQQQQPPPPAQQQSMAARQQPQPIQQQQQQQNNAQQQQQLQQTQQQMRHAMSSGQTPPMAVQPQPGRMAPQQVSMQQMQNPGGYVPPPRGQQPHTQQPHSQPMGAGQTRLAGRPPMVPSANANNAPQQGPAIQRTNSGPQSSSSIPSNDQQQQPSTNVSRPPLPTDDSTKHAQEEAEFDAIARRRGL
mmetsp:Transcript_19310/g.29311  ORF Transcript_19310/g.29311 Transcript_19310/m.29311 type:complete len:492 (-) Transcript_19310:336-1811(-)